jgi:hypothetical protein
VAAGGPGVGPPTADEVPEPAAEEVKTDG